METSLIQRIVITGNLVLEGPAHFGNGDESAATDMPVLRDSATAQPMLTGASIAGALRNFAARRDPEAAHRLFGGLKGTTTRLSALCIDDAISSGVETELRDGVALDTATRTAEPNQKFDFEIVPQGSQFGLCFELALEGDDADLKDTLAYALYGLQQGQITLGKRKTRGFGTCKVPSWNVTTYDYKNPADVLAWLKPKHGANKPAQIGQDIFALLGVERADLPRADFKIEAEFALEGSLLIRSDATSAADMGHLHSRRDGEMKPILSGASLAGALRARALRIANTLAFGKGTNFVNQMFGPRRKKDIDEIASHASHIERETQLAESQDKITLRASHITVKETVIEAGITDLVQQRVKIDRFTGGAFPSALFSQQPLFGKPETRVRVELLLRKPLDGDDADAQHNAEIGMALLLLKDLWTSDLPIGGETSVGRGRLRGLSAHIWRGQDEWVLEQSGADGLAFSKGNAHALNEWVQALQEVLNR